MRPTDRQRQELGARIEEERRARKWSAARLAREITAKLDLPPGKALSGTSVGNWESGQNAPARMEVVEAVEAVLFPDRPGYLTSVLTTEPPALVGLPSIGESEREALTRMEARFEVMLGEFQQKMQEVLGELRQSRPHEDREPRSSSD